ncbi:MAG: glycerophosphodiester phosphodiesterase [Clostridiaceae bacterium]|nr:glycerophosphodiester phosphodiesterase [Clostridiaceae bacterium]
MKEFMTKPIAQRGLHNEKYTENSLSGFENAIKYGFPIEIDIHLVSDINIYVFHDDNLKRMTGFDKPIKLSCKEEIRKLRLAGTNEHIPALEEVFELVDGKVPLLIEIKKCGRPKETAKILSNMLENYKGTAAVQSFYPDYLYHFKKCSPKVNRGQLATASFPDDIPHIQRFVSRNMFGNPIVRPSFITYDFKCLPRTAVSFYKKLGLVVLGYTVRSQEEEMQARKYCDNIIFENYIPD